MSIAVQSNVKKWGNGNGIRLSKEMLLTCGLKEDEAIDIVVDNEKIVIKKHRQPSLIEQLQNYSGFYVGDEETKEWMDSSPMGEEIW